jgi:hypothetical protein
MRRQGRNLSRSAAVKQLGHRSFAYAHHDGDVGLGHPAALQLVDSPPSHGCGLGLRLRSSVSAIFGPPDLAVHIVRHSQLVAEYVARSCPLAAPRGVPVRAGWLVRAAR